MNKKEKKLRYFIGLDIGTNSVGMAATDPDYHILRTKGMDMWCVNSFDEANTAKKRGTYRISRRRRGREVARRGVLRELFAEEIEKVDPGFFIRLDESKFFVEDRCLENKQKYALFADKLFTDVEYYAKYPTIFHLRKELIESADPHDVRLIYLALANMFKHRGHFLNTSLGVTDDTEDIGTTYQSFLDTITDTDFEFPTDIQKDRLRDILSGNDLRKEKVEKLSELFDISKKQKQEYQLLNLMCGLKGKLADIFPDKEYDEEQKKMSFSFEDYDYETKDGDLRNILDEDEMEVIDAVKSMHDNGMLAGIMKDYPYLSMARVASYEKHEKDLRILKRVLKKYDKKEYFHMFRNKNAAPGSYSAYVGSVNYHGVYRRGIDGRKQEDLYKHIEKVIEKFPQDDEDIVYIVNEIEKENFLPKQLTASNGVIPNQLHAREMKAILQQVEQYLPFLTEKDETGLSVSEKILQLFMFQIPYYVGPLGQEYKDKKGYNVWAERKEAGRIYPWNFEDKIDVKKSAEKFIQRMVKHCTYLSGEKVLPKQSLLYEKFQVLNELNNLCIHGEKISVGLKQDIYHDLFETGKKVTMNRLTNYLIEKRIIQKEEKETCISGIDGGFSCSLTSIGKFKGVFEEEMNTEECQNMMEDIIFCGAVYGSDKSMFKEVIEEKYGSLLSASQKKRIWGFKFSGWGRLSKEFLTLPGAAKEDGEIKSLIQAMWDTNNNLMELLSDRFTYTDSLQDKIELVEKPLSAWTIDDLDGMYLSAPVKRMIWRTLRMVNEYEQVLGYPPERIFVEMTRSDGEKGVRTISRKKKLMKLYKDLGKKGKPWLEMIDSIPEQDFRIKKLYLYFLQQGRCMYTGEEIKFNDLMNDNLYDIDHIYPRHFIKDDSLENNLVLVQKRKNAHKSDKFPIEEDIRKSQADFWMELRKQNFITQEKYNRLTRNTGFTDEEKSSFIKRQLVETGQAAKKVTQILRQAFPDSEIVFVKASLVSNLRQKFQLYKVRCVNDYHHAHDAYLNIVAGNAYLMKFTKNPINFIKEAIKQPQKPEYHYNMARLFDWDVRRNGEYAWIAPKEEDPGTIQTVKKYLHKASPAVTKMAHENQGSITREVTIWSAKKAAKGKTGAYIPVKMNDERLDVTRYGGYTSIAVSGYTLLEYKVGDKTVKSLEALPVYLGRSETLSDEQIIGYFSKRIQLENKKEVSDFKILRRMIPSGSLIKYNGFYYYLGGKAGNSIYLRSAVQLCLPDKYMYYVKKLEKAFDIHYFGEKDRNGVQIISKEKNIILYDLIISKYENSIFRKKGGAIGSCIIKGRDKFSKLEIDVQCAVLMQIFLDFRKCTGVNLSEIGGSNKSGVINMNKKINTAAEFELIEQSVTGIYKRNTNLL